MYNSSWWLLTRIDALDYFHATAFTQFSWRYRCPVKGVGTSWIVVAIALETFDFVSSYFLKDFQILEDFLSLQLWNPWSFKGKFTDIFILFLDLILSILGYWILLKTYTCILLRHWRIQYKRWIWEDTSGRGTVLNPWLGPMHFEWKVLIWLIEDDVDEPILSFLQTTN